MIKYVMLYLRRRKGYTFIFVKYCIYDGSGLRINVLLYFTWTWTQDIMVVCGATDGYICIRPVSYLTLSHEGEAGTGENINISVKHWHWEMKRNGWLYLLLLV